MSKSTFPILEVQGNRLTSIHGDVSWFYSMLPSDTSQMDYVERDGFFESLARGLNNLNLDSYFKFYKVADCSFLETNGSQLPSFSGIEFTEQDRPLECFFQTSQIFSEVGIYDDYLSFNGKYLRVFSVGEFSDDEAHEHLIPQDVDYVLRFRKKPKDKSISKLERIRTGHLSSFLKSKRDISSEGAYSQAEGLMHDLIHGSESMFEMEMFFLLRSNSLEDLNTMSEAFFSEMLIRGIKVFAEGQSLRSFKSGLTSIFNELIPGVKPQLGLRTLPNKTSHLRYLLPVERSFLMDEGMELNDNSGRAIYFDPFTDAIKNRNMLVTGISGGGKSVFVNKIVHHLIEDHPTVILDKGGSFRKLTKYYGGSNLEHKFNPFQFKDPMYLREIILSVVDTDKFGKLEKGKLLRAIKEALPKSESFFGFIDNLKEDFPEIDLYFEDFKDYICDEHIDSKSILYVDVENYPKSVIAPIIIFILEYFKNIPEKEKILVFDECWSFLGDHSSYIDECFRTFRKTGAFPIAISQSLKDFSSLGDDLANSITNNCYFKVFFPQEMEERHDITSFDVENIGSLEFQKGVFSECYLKSTDNRFRKIIRNYLTPLELELFHTEAGKDKKLESFLSKFEEFFDSSKEAIEAYVRLRHENFQNNNVIYFDI
ncbi:MAG: hypothetical protein VXV96_11630 [Bdellovibrionota bacterium]|nr:hypothetical protein [Bdellovibrionota bacterium]